MSNVDSSRMTWRKSSYSGDGDNGDCVEVGFAEPSVAVRDSKNPTGELLAVPQESWARFLRSL